MYFMKQQNILDFDDSYRAATSHRSSHWEVLLEFWNLMYLYGCSDYRGAPIRRTPFLKNTPGRVFFCFQGFQFVFHLLSLQLSSTFL